MVNKVRSVPMVFDWIGFGNAVTAMRIEAGLTQYQLGQLCELSGSAIGDIETAKWGDARVSTILAIANVFDLDIRHYWILSDTRIPAKKKVVK